MESVFLEIEGRLVPFFLSFSEYSGASIIKLQFEGYDSVLKVNEFIGCNVFLTTGTSEDYQSDDVQSLIGYNVLMQDNKLLGSIIEVKPNHGQWLLNIISTKNNDVLVPFHEHFIVSIDEKKKIIVMDIPEGLIEIN
jgi:16S rRNA processing protein RimM